MQKVRAKLFAVLRRIAGTHHINHMKTVEIDIAFEEQCHRGIIALAKTRRIGLVPQGKTSQAILFHKLHFLFGTQECSRIVESGNYRRVHAGKQFGQLFTPAENLDCTTHTVNQTLRTDTPDTGTESEGYTTYSFIVVHY